MSRFIAWFGKPHVQVRFWGGWALAWLALDPLIMLTGLAKSVPVVNQESLFANIASCGTAWVAAMSYLHARSVNDAQLHRKLDHIIEHHPDIPALEESADQPG